MRTSRLFILLSLIYYSCNSTSTGTKEEPVALSVDSVRIIEPEASNTGSVEDLPIIPEQNESPVAEVLEDTMKEGVKTRGIKKDDINEARELFKKAEKYEFGDGVKKDVAKAIGLYRESAELDFPAAQYSLAFLINDEKESLEWLTRSAENGYSDAQYELAIQYLYGYGVRSDMKKSIFWFEKSAESGHKIGQYKLALMYDTGEGVRQNLGKAAELYRKSADQGVGIAQFNLAMMYITGEGVDTVNMDMAAFWMDKARSAGVRDAKKAWNKFQLEAYN